MSGQDMQDTLLLGATSLIAVVFCQKELLTEPFSLPRHLHVKGVS